MNMTEQEFYKSVAQTVQEGIIELLIEARDKGKTLDDVITGWEDGLKRARE